jgi:hypothetical protein
MIFKKRDYIEVAGEKRLVICADEEYAVCAMVARDIDDYSIYIDLDNIVVYPNADEHRQEFIDTVGEIDIINNLDDGDELIEQKNDTPFLN